MKKRISVILAIVFVCGLLFGCGSASTSSSRDSSSLYSMNTEMSDEAVTSDSMPDDNDYYSSESGSDGGTALNTTVIAGAGTDSDVSDKMIYTAYAQIETTEFEDSINAVYDILDEFEAYVEDSYVTGKSYSSEYYGYQSYRNAEFVLRVPKENYTQLLTNLSSVGNVLSLDSSSRNITTQYTDTESRLETYRIEEERLQEMLKIAESVDDMITIESRLSEVRYEIESLTSTLREWDNQVDYSTVTLSINEVGKLTEQYPVKRTYWQKIGDGIMSTLGAVGEFFKGLFMYFVILLPVIVIIAVIVTAVIFIVRAVRKKKRKKSVLYSENREEKTDTPE
jgi:hypothetical protein